MSNQRWHNPPIHLARERRHTALPLVGESFAGVYHILGVLGRGSSSTVFRARRTVVERGETYEQDVALKILRPEHLDRPDQVERFRREALHVSNLRHPNTVRLYDYGQLDGGLVFAAIELLKGRSLSAVLVRKKRLPYVRAIHIVTQILWGLAEAHRYGLIHRDLKPANIFVCRGEPERAKVLDFGLVLDARFERLTKQGYIAGTPEYMAPEQASGRLLSKAVDVYAVGLMLY